MRITASLVLYNNPPEQFSRAIASFLAACEGKLFVVDNSPEPLRSEYFSDSRVIYKPTGRNLGFGAGHNVALRELIPHSDFHLILNPDVWFGTDVLNVLVQALVERPDAGAVMPRIEYPNGSLQKLCKLLPAPHHLFLRRFLGFGFIRESVNRKYELHGLSQRRISSVPVLSGCFLLIRSRLLQTTGFFDERYFMYMEDVDLIRRIGDVSETIYQPTVSIVHGYEKGSYKKPLLLKYHLRSAFHYFCKWGWFLDSTRRMRNSRALRMILSDVSNNKL